MTVRFSATTEIVAPVDVVFELATSIDAHLGAMASSRERVVGGVSSGTIGLHETVTWRAWHFYLAESGIPWLMTSRVTEFERNRRFADEQLRGPFRRFEHTHTFKEADGVTEMYDEIVFDAPLGLIGDAIETVFLGGYMRKLIDQRNAYLKFAAESAD